MDLIVTDVKIPDIDGLEVLKRAKEINHDIDNRGWDKTGYPF